MGHYQAVNDEQHIGNCPRTTVILQLNQEYEQSLIEEVIPHELVLKHCKGNRSATNGRSKSVGILKGKWRTLRLDAPCLEVWYDAMFGAQAILTKRKDGLSRGTTKEDVGKK